MVNAEIKNARLEIFQDTLVWNAGIWYNGDWYFGVWRDGEWKYGTWQNGVWYKGTWRNGTFKSGIIYKGNFFRGKIEGGEIRGGTFIDIEVSKNVKEYTEDEFQDKEQTAVEQQQVATAQAQPINSNKVKVNTTLSSSQQTNNELQPKMQQEKKEYNNMKTLKKFEEFVQESVGELEQSFIDTNLDETELEDSDKPNLGKLKQKAGISIIETPSKTEAYNAKMRMGGDIIVDPKDPDKQLHQVNPTK
jgi:hypothetical protein